MTRTVTIAASVLVVLVIAIGLYITGTPATQRALRLDQERVNGLRRTSNAISGYWHRTGDLPGNLEQLVDGIYMDALPVDPETGEPYEYTTLGAENFSLCSEFSLAYDSDEVTEFWQHPAGRHCFSFEMDL
ncbi:MAG: hypothetical protein WD406_07445 [Pseudohongiellaceae bacterium]